MRIAQHRHGVVHRPQVIDAGVPRWLLQAEVRVGRWQRTGRQTVVTHNAALSAEQRRAIAALEVGPRAALDGVTALQHLGVDVRDDGRLHLIAPKGSSPKHPPGVRVHESRRFAESDVTVRDGVRVVRGAVATIHAALWARTDREAQFLVVLAVQQQLATVAQLQDAVEAVLRSPRRAVLRRVLHDVAAGIRSIGELDVARALRHRGLPEPDRQVLRQRPSGRQYLDCRWDTYRITLEVDGEQHDAPEQRLQDLLRDLALVAESDAVVRIPLVLFRLDRERILDGLESVFASRGWRRAA